MHAQLSASRACLPPPLLALCCVCCRPIDRDVVPVRISVFALDGRHILETEGRGTVGQMLRAEQSSSRWGRASESERLGVGCSQCQAGSQHPLCACVLLTNSSSSLSRAERCTLIRAAQRATGSELRVGLRLWRDSEGTRERRLGNELALRWTSEADSTGAARSSGCESGFFSDR